MKEEVNITKAAPISLKAELLFYNRISSIKKMAESEKMRGELLERFARYQKVWKIYFAKKT